MNENHTYTVRGDFTVIREDDPELRASHAHTFRSIQASNARQAIGIVGQRIADAAEALLRCDEFEK